MASEGEPRERIMSIEEAAYLWAAAVHEHERACLRLALGTLARPEAILELSSFQIDCGARLIRLNPPGRKQTKKRRPTVPMCETLAPHVTGLPPGPVVSYKGRAVKNIRGPINRLKKRARRMVRDEAARAARRCRRTGRRGEAWAAIAAARACGDALLEITPYTIRHTMASVPRKRQVPPWEVAGFLGHTSGYKTTERHAIFDPDHLGQAVQAIDAYFADLENAIRTLPDQLSTETTPLRSSCVLAPEVQRLQPNEKLVEPDGLEPTTSTMPL